MADEPQNAVILFADFVGSSRLSDTLKPADCDAVMSDFQAIGSEILRDLKKELPKELRCCDGSIRGDELVLIMVLPKRDSRVTGDPCGSVTARATRAAIQLAVALNVRWFLSASNRPRIVARATPFRVAVGIHYGPVIVRGRTRGTWEPDKSGWSWEPTRPKPKKPEGFAINFASGSRAPLAKGPPPVLRCLTRSSAHVSGRACPCGWALLFGGRLRALSRENRYMRCSLKT